LISRRPYKAPIPHDEAVQIIAVAKNTHFDPDITDAFLQIHQEFRDIAKRYPDMDPRRPPKFPHLWPPQTPPPEHANHS